MNDRVKIRNNALNASQLMDSIIISPAWNQNIFTDSVQLFPGEVLGESNWQEKFTVGFVELSAKLQETLKNTHQELIEAVGKNASLGSNLHLPSSSLVIDNEKVRLFDKASLQLIQSMETFKKVYQSSDHGTKSRIRQDDLDEQDSIPGLGQAIRELNIAQDGLLSTVRSVGYLQGSVSSLANSTLGVQQVKEQLLCSFEDSSVQATLERLTAMSTTLEKARQNYCPLTTLSARPSLSHVVE
ncbi:hypothetical protein BGZ76_007291 [Entomortierella beljakovae]|nr:hypothetical protein BGZ76_007291 [Entomortierella beljakovae]